MKVRITLIIGCIIFLLSSCSDCPKRDFFTEVRDTVYLSSDNYWFVDTCGISANSLNYFPSEMQILDVGFEGYTLMKDSVYILCDKDDLRFCESWFDFKMKENEEVEIGGNTDVKLILIKDGNYYFMMDSKYGTSMPNMSSILMWSVSYQNGIQAVGYIYRHNMEVMNSVGDTVLLYQDAVKEALHRNIKK